MGGAGRGMKIWTKDMMKGVNGLMNGMGGGVVNA